MFLAIKQLSILLKKIWIQRWRRKAFTFVEMVIPLFMFIILTIIRHSMTSDVKSHCHYDAKGLPSAGIQPTMDGLTQSYDNKCRVLETSGGDSRYINNKILRSNLSYIGEGVLNLLKFVGSRENFTLNTKDTITFLRKIEYINNNSKVDYFSTNSNFYKNIKELRIYLYDFYKSKGLSGFKNLKNLMFKLPKVSKKKNKKIIDKEWYDGYEILLKNIVDTLNLDNFVRERLEKTRNSEKTVCGGFKIPGFKNCSYYKYLTEITSRIKPLAAGYILITPQNNKTEKIYEYFTSLFSKLHDIVEYIKYFKENEDVIKYVLNQSDINQILEKIIILLTKMSENDEFGENNDVSDSFRLLLLIFEHAKNYGSYTDQIVDILSNEIGEIIENALPCLYFDRVRFVKNETDMEEKALCLQNYNMYYTGIVLHNTSTLEKVLLNSNQKLNTTNSIVYSMRPLNSIIDTGRKVFSKGHVRNMPRDDFNYDLKYITSGYIYFQDIIDRILIEDKIKMKLPDFGIFIQQEPSSCTLPATPFDVSHNVSLCIICSFIFTFGILVKNVCTEKETHIVDMMYIHGLPEILHYMAYWLDTIFLNSIICAIISTMLVYGEILVSVSFWAILVPLILYIITTTSQAIILCNIVTNSNYGAALMAFIYLMSFLPSALHIIGEPGFTYVFLLLPQSTVSSLLEIYINSYVGNYYFFEIFNDLYLYTGLQFSHTCYFLLGDTILYTMIAFIIIPLLKKLKYTRFWACIVQKVLFFRKNLETDEIYLSIIEEPNENDVRTVHIDNLVLKYPNGVYGLRGATMSFYNNQITAFLGHNGAGKSSLVKVLSGMEKASSGFARIYGKDLRYDINEIRRMIGICPQDNVLFPYLSVIEHFTFFGGLMNIPKAILCSEIEVILHDTGLSYKRYCLASDLSGGMKRKLCMGIALLGDSKLIILDEPTSGVDPLQRKSIWDLIFKIKKGRTVILSTHYMDEAEILGDRIVVMNNGMVCAEGTIQFLKEQLNNEIIIKIKNICIENCNDSEFENVMNQYCFIEKKTPLYKYYRVLKDKMETVKDLLNYLNINVSDVCEDYQIYLPDFQDFFLKLCRKNNHSTDTELLNNTSTEDVTKDVFGLKHPKYEEVTNKCKLFWIRYFVLLKKKYKIFKNDIILELITRLFPLLTIILALAYQAAVRHNNSIEVSRVYDDPLVVDISEGLSEFALQSYLSFNEYLDDYDYKSGKSYIKNLYKSPGLGNYCLNNNITRYEDIKYQNCNITDVDAIDAISTIIDKKNDIFKYISNKTCCCGYGFWNCSTFTFSIETPEFKIKPNISLFDFSTFNISHARLGQPDIIGKHTNGSLDHFMIGGYQFFLKNNLSHNDKDKETEMNGYIDLKHFAPEFFNLTRINITYLKENQKYNLTNIHYSFDVLVKNYIDNFAVTRNGKIWFNNRYYISSTAFLNTLSNAFLRNSYEMNGDEFNTTGIYTIKHSMVGQKSQTRRDFDHMLTSGIVSLGVLFSITMMTAGNVKLLINERILLINDLIRCTGTGRVVYWLSYFTFDYIIFVIGTGIIIVLCYIFDADFLVYNWNCFSSVTTVLLLFGLNYILSIYITQHLYSEPVKGYISTGLSSFFLGAAFQVIYICIVSYSSYSTKFGVIERICLYLFALCPQFNVNLTIFKSLLYSFTMQKLSDSLENEDNLNINDIISQPSLYEWNQITVHIVMLSITFVIRIPLLYLVDRGWDAVPFLKKIRSIYLKCFFKNLLSSKDIIHPTVLKEKEIVEGIDLNDETSNYGVVCNNVSKFYGFNKLAVKDMSLCALKGECLGFLGTNGAGKSTTFSILTKTIQEDFGITKAFGTYGYCPQIHSLNMNITPKNQIKMYGLLRGISKKDIDIVVNWILEQMSLTEHADKLTTELSGGNKRKLSTGIAIIGNPNIIYLDEPTSGMDPKSQTFIWNVIDKLRELNKTIIMCSHSMDECEIVCQKICIMVDGKIKIIGSMQTLRNELGYQYKLRVKAKDNCKEKICKIIEEYLPTISNPLIQYNSITYMLKFEKNIYQEMLTTIEELKEKKLIIDHNYRPVNLDDIFSVVADGCEAQGR